MNVLVLCNGQPPEAALFEQCRSWATYFIAADGGGNIARSLGSPPDLVIGDLDSFQAEEGDDFEVRHDPDQETNDLEKALRHASERDAKAVIVLGATGLRIDHTLKNLSVLKQFNEKFETIFFRDNFGDTLLIPNTFVKEIPTGTPVSLFPLSGRVSGITTSGLKYPLQNEKLENGMRDGSSNRVNSTPIEIRYDEGDLILFIANQL